MLGWKLRRWWIEFSSRRCSTGRSREQVGAMVYFLQGAALASGSQVHGMKEDCQALDRVLIFRQDRRETDAQSGC